MKNETPRFSLDELCALVDLPRRTVRFYMQQGLVDRPIGSGRGAHYSSRHAEQLLSVKKWKDAGLSLQRIGELVGGAATSVPPPPVRPGQVEVWSRVFIADGVELQIEPKRSGLSPAQVGALVREIVAAYEHTQQEEDR